ncbi:MAG: transposase [Gemmatimonadetes bacterium]|nr:transposase [Gemmatimonadota bacterium]
MYLAAPFRDRLVALGIARSATVSGPGDKAHMESFVHSLRAEVVRGPTFVSDAMLRCTHLHYFRHYNLTRLHSALGFRTQVDYDRQPS